MSHYVTRRDQWKKLWSKNSRSNLGNCANWVIYSALNYIFCNVCNPAAQTVKTKKSLLIIPDADISDLHLLYDACHLSLIHPARGEIDDYIVEYELRRLRQADGPWIPARPRD